MQKEAAMAYFQLLSQRAVENQEILKIGPPQDRDMNLRPLTPKQDCYS
jgi:hypothetical protein